MEYIVHHRCRDLSATGERLNIPYGSIFGTIGQFIATSEGKAICYEDSDLAHNYFARNDDGKGLRRGALTYAIAWSSRKRQSASGRRQRFTDAEIELLEKEWKHFLIPDINVILFNHAFFNAELGELERLAHALNIKV